MRGPTRLCARVTTRARDNNRTEVALFVAPNAFGAFSLFWILSWKSPKRDEQSKTNG
jgi:hypothetical protein